MKSRTPEQRIENWIIENQIPELPLRRDVNETLILYNK